MMVTSCMNVLHLASEAVYIHKVCSNNDAFVQHAEIVSPWTLPVSRSGNAGLRRKGTENIAATVDSGRPNVKAKAMSTTRREPESSAVAHFFCNAIRMVSALLQVR